MYKYFENMTNEIKMFLLDLGNEYFIKTIFYNNPHVSYSWLPSETIKPLKYNYVDNPFEAIDKLLSTTSITERGCILDIEGSQYLGYKIDNSIIYFDKEENTFKRVLNYKSNIITDCLKGTYVSLNETYKNLSISGTKLLSLL